MVWSGAGVCVRTRVETVREPRATKKIHPPAPCAERLSSPEPKSKQHNIGERGHKVARTSI
eukprot:3843338-Prymnesium_polylepis.1